MHQELQTLPHQYTEGDTLPPVVASFEFDTAGYSEFAALVERPDGTLFTRVGVVVDSQTVRFDWQAADWLKGCSQMTLRLTETGGGISHTAPVLVETFDAPAAVTP